MLRNLNIKIFIILSVIVVQLIFVSSCTDADKIELANSKNPDMGNKIGNLLNYGVIANDEKSIYYSASKGTQVTLNKKNIDTGEHQVLNNGLCVFLNVVGGFIYYVDDIDDTIHRMDTNGIKNERLSDIKVEFLFVFNNTIYALGGEGDKYIGNLYAMSIDGSGLNILLDERVQQIYFYDNALFYTTIHDEQTFLYKMDMDGGNKELILQDMKMANWLVYKDSIYYITQGGIKEVRKVIIGTKEDSLVYEINKEIPNGFFNADNNFAYFIATAPSAYTYLNLDTGDIKTSSFHGDITVGLYAIGNKVFYYKNQNQNEILYSMNVDGSGEKRFN